MTGLRKRHSRKVKLRVVVEVLKGEKINPIKSSKINVYRTCIIPYTPTVSGKIYRQMAVCAK